MQCVSECDFPSSKKRYCLFRYVVKYKSYSCNCFLLLFLRMRRARLLCASGQRPCGSSQEHDLHKRSQYGFSFKNRAKKIKLVVAVRDFAEKQLLLPSNGSFHSYSKLDTQFVVWNVFATTPFSLSPKNSCFLVAGCVPYRGFYSKAAAKKYSRKLSEVGFEVYVAGIDAYSTLGWFNDPLLSTVINRSDESLAELIIHELAHQKSTLKMMQYSMKVLQQPSRRRV